MKRAWASVYSLSGGARDGRSQAECRSVRLPDGRRTCPVCEPQRYAEHAAKHRSDRP